MKSITYDDKIAMMLPPGESGVKLMDYDAVLNNKALEYIDIDLDDGVVVNYAKFEGWWGRYEYN